MAPDEQILSQTQEKEMARGTGHSKRGILRRRAVGPGARIGASLTVAFLLVLAPSQTRLAHASCPSLDPTDTATGTSALANECGGFNNTAYGYFALFSNTTGIANTADGTEALFSNLTGNENTATGSIALNNNTTGSENTAAGFGALKGNTGGGENTAAGFQALDSNTTGSDNTAAGYEALANNNADANTAAGYQALKNNTTGSGNTAAGVSALQDNNTGSNNTAAGDDALKSNGTGSDITAVGDGADVGADGLINATAIGANATVSESNALVLGGTGPSAVKVGIGTASPTSTLTVFGTIESTSGGIKFPDGSTQTTAGVTSVSASGPLSSSGGTSPTISLIGTVGIANGGTGITTSPSGVGQFLRSTGLGSWGVSAIQAGDLPAGSSNYIQNGTSQQASANFNIAGSGTLGGTLTVAGTGSSSVAGSLGIGMTSPHSLLQVGTPSTSYGSYLQLPMVMAGTRPPVSDCNASTFVGRLVLQYDATRVRTTLWSCSPAGVWTRLAQGG